MLTSSGRNIFTTSYILYLIFCFVLFYNFSKPEIELFINKYHSVYSDLFFKYITYLGDGAFFIIVAVAVLIYNYKKGILFVAAGLLQMLIVRGLKWYIFPGEPRPYLFLKHNFPEQPIHFVDGEVLNTIDSIPSGHTSTSFTIFTMLVLLFFYKKPLLSFLCFLVAVLVGYSRVYLMQHFVFDVFFGSLIGVISAFVIMQYLTKYILKPSELPKKIYSD